MCQWSEHAFVHTLGSARAFGGKGVRVNTVVDVRGAGYLDHYLYPYRYLGGIQIPALHGEETLRRMNETHR